MRLEISDEDFTRRDKALMRAAAYFLLHTIGDMDEAAVPEGTSVTRTVTETATVGDLTHTKATSVTTANPPPPPPVASAATAPATDANSAAASVAANTLRIVPEFPTVPVPAFNVPPPPPPTGNIVNFPTAGTVPPPPAANIAATNVAPSNVTTAAVVPSVVSAENVELDSAGMPWDARIHQKGKNKKKDLTWKLIKGIEEKSPGLVQAVTAELAAARKAGAAPSVATPVPLPLPVPPVTNGAAAPSVPPPPVSSPVSVPPPPAVGAVGASPFKALIDKITELTRQQKLPPARVAEICQLHGAPSLMALHGMPHLVADVEKSIDAAALGLL